MAINRYKPEGRRLYLVQHGEAKTKDEDPARPLTDAGRETAKRVAAWAANAGVHVDQIWHSGKKRAEETALVFAGSLNPTKGVQAVSELGPVDNVKSVAHDLTQQTVTVMIVGHLPFLSRLVNSLMGTDKDRAVIAFRNAGLVGLVQTDTGWRIGMVIPPEMIS